ncbi:dynamin family protein [Blastococcus sp. SYSU D00669]
MSTPHGPGAGTGTVAAVRDLLEEASAAYADDPEVTDRLSELRRRLDEPLRVAIVGRVKAGKSTLLNALVGERLAPTDAGECTRVVTVYRHGAVPRVVLEELSGARHVLPVHRADGALQLDLGGIPPEQVARLVVDWPTPGLAAATLVDTPGISSLSADTSGRTQAFLEAGHRLPGADAVVFLTRQMQPDDVAFLSTFQQEAGDVGVSTTTLTVLSRADEVGAGRLDSMRAARGIAERMARDPAVRAVSHDVVPVAGLLALAGRMLRHRDFVALRTLANAPGPDVEAMLLTADRFVREEAPVALAPAVRSSLLERFGLFGIRQSIVLIRAGVDDASGLAEELLRRSGLVDLQQRIAVHFTRRGAQVKAATALHRLERVLRAAPRPEAAFLWDELERVRLEAHDLAELALLARLRAVDGPLPPPLRGDAERLLGAEGDAPENRLGLPLGSSQDQVLAAAGEAVARWRALLEDPLLDRAATDAGAVVLRSCLAVQAAVDGAGSEAGGAAS